MVLNHRGRVNNFHDFNHRFSIGTGDRIIAVASDEQPADDRLPWFRRNDVAGMADFIAALLSR